MSLRRTRGHGNGVARAMVAHISCQIFTLGLPGSVPMTAPVVVSHQRLIVADCRVERTQNRAYESPGDSMTGSSPSMIGPSGQPPFPSPRTCEIIESPMYVLGAGPGSVTERLRPPVG